MRSLLLIIIFFASTSWAAAEDSTNYFSSGLLLKHGKQTLRASMDSSGLWTLGIGGLATLAALEYDVPTRQAWKDHQKMSEADSRTGDYWGQGVILIYGIQYYLDPEKALPGIEGLLVGGAIVQIAKYSIHRTRPNQKANVSMPSGHTQAAFSLAASMNESYGYLKALPFWGMAILTGASRISDDQHWLSDVIAGATLGIVYGRAAFKHHSTIQPDLQITHGQLRGGSLAFNYSW